MKRDIVIEDERGRELYRDGPYTASGAVLPWNRVIDEIEATSLDDLIARMKIRYSTCGLINVAEPQVSQLAVAEGYYSASLRKLLRRGR